MSVQALYDGVADRYDEMANVTRYAGPAWLARQLVGIPQPATVLDLGCATGTLGSVLRDAFPASQIDGLDISAAMVALARARMVYSRVVEADLNDPIGYPDHSFDAIVALGFVEFLEAPGRLLAEIARLLVPGGLAWISFQAHRPDEPDVAPRTSYSGDVVHRAYTLEEVSQLIRSAGLTLFRVEPEIGYVSRSGFACPYLFCSVRSGEVTREGCS